MSFQMQTPQRPLPGAYFATPATTQNQGALTARQLTGPQRISPQNATSQSNAVATTGRATAKSAEESLSPVERAAKTINDTLAQELKYPELDSYITQGISSEYDLSSTPSRAPFQQGKVFSIPDKIFEQANYGNLHTELGLFADINHAFIIIDNAVYLWDYTHPDPPLVGFEEQKLGINAVQMVVPRDGVFVKSISRLLVVATVHEIILVGVSLEKPPGGSYTVALYQTKMSIPVRGLNVNYIEGSADGRIFFTGEADNDVYELTYQQEERWFYSRCQKVNHTRSRLAAITPSFTFSAKSPPETTIKLRVDSSRRLLYALSSASTIRVFHMKTVATLSLTIMKRWRDILNNISHMISQTDLINANTRIVDIHPIPAQEASRLHLMATTSNGCRIFLSATQSFGYMNTDSIGGSMSMQVHHVKFPPPDENSASTQGSAAAASMSQPNTSSKALTNTKKAFRFGPGFFLSVVERESQPNIHEVFLSGPDRGRIIRPQEPLASSKYPEQAMWADLGDKVITAGLATEPFSATSTPQGFANELAVQFDKPATVVAIITSTGIHHFRRQRLVDMFVSALRMNKSDEGLAGIANRFIRLYGRSETAATTLAVACGQGIEIASDGRSVAATDPVVTENAKTAFIEYGGKPHVNENAVADQSISANDMVVLSSRHDGLALYVSRLVRFFWKSTVMRETATPIGGLSVQSTVKIEKLQIIQQSLNELKEFLDNNKTFIDGLAGPEALGRVSTRQQEIALQAEHRALHSLVTLIGSIVEGISFVQMLFSERMEEIILPLNPETREDVRKLTFEALFSTAKGKEIAKELVKAIVNRNIINGANVETVAEALRRRCGSFCSAGDVVIFRAQEQLRRAAETGGGTELGRNLLNESLRLFKDASSDLSLEQLENAMQQYTGMQFFAGAIDLALRVAQEADRGNRALIWIQNGRPEGDLGAAVFAKRKRCYDLIHDVITALEQSTQRTTDLNDAASSMAATRRQEAYAIIDTSEDQVFQIDLYDWYIDQGQADRLLVIQSPYVVTYLEQRFDSNITIANLLWRYFSQAGDPMRAAGVQLNLAKSGYPLTLNERIEYLGRAKANASASSFNAGRQHRQQLLHEIGECLDIAGIQDDLIQRLRDDDRLVPERKSEILRLLDGPIQQVSVLYNEFVDQAGYHDLALLIYQIANHRNPIDIRDTWRNLIDKTHTDASASGRTPWEAVANQVRTLGTRLQTSESTFPVPVLLNILKRYAFEFQRGVGPATWVVDVFLDLSVPFEVLFSNLEYLLYNQEAPFVGANRHYLADDMLYVAGRWFEESTRGLNALFGGDANARSMSETLANLPGYGLSREKVEDCQQLGRQIDMVLR